MISCSSNREINGVYKSNRAELGFFITTIKFKENGVFEYNFSGDLINKDLSGNYIIRNRTAYLKFKTNKNEVESVAEGLNSNSHNYELKKEHNILYHIKFKIDNDKLLSYRIDNGKLVRNGKVYDGKNWILKPIYLEKIK
jgi:hypothetical protein